MTALCARGCTYPDDDNPRPAAPCSEVCTRCEHQTRDGLRDLPGLWADLGDTRRGQRPRTGGRSADAPQPISGEAVAARSAIRACLVAWCLILEEDFRMQVPADTVRAMARHVAVQAGRILAHPEHADQLVHDVTTAVREARRLAYPVSSLTVECTCGQRVRVDQDPDVVTTCRGCDEAGTSLWWQERLVPETTELMTARIGVDWLSREHRITVEEDAVRQWVRRGYLRPATRRRQPGATHGQPAALYAPIALLMAATRTDRGRSVAAEVAESLVAGAIVTVGGA